MEADFITLYLILLDLTLAAVASSFMTNFTVIGESLGICFMSKFESSLNLTNL